MAFHQDKTLKNLKVQSRSRRKPTKKEKEIQRIEANLQIYKKIKRSKAEVRDDALQKRKRIPKSKVEVEANLQKKEKEIQSKVEVEANLQKKKKKSSPRSKSKRTYKKRTSPRSNEPKQEIQSRSQPKEPKKKKD